STAPSSPSTTADSSAPPTSGSAGVTGVPSSGVPSTPTSDEPSRPETTPSTTSAAPTPTTASPPVTSDEVVTVNPSTTPTVRVVEPSAPSRAQHTSPLTWVFACLAVVIGVAALVILRRRIPVQRAGSGAPTTVELQEAPDRSVPKSSATFAAVE